MKIWVDADACPRAARELVFRAGVRYGFETILVANSALSIPDEPEISLVLVDKGLDVADNYIADNVTKGDLVITADIPLAARIVDAGALGLDPRGQVFDEDNVHGKLAGRNLMSELRDMGVMGGGPPPYKPKDKTRFATELDRILTPIWMAIHNPK